MDEVAKCAIQSLAEMFAANKMYNSAKGCIVGLRPMVIVCNVRGKAQWNVVAY